MIPMMITEQLPHLLHLLDDSSPVVRNEVRQALITYGYFLRPASREWVREKEEELKEEWDRVCREAEAMALEDTWLSWMLFDKPAQQLEAAMLSLELGGSLSTSFIQSTIDDLADEFEEQYKRLNTENLLEFIFHKKGFDRTLRERRYLQHRLGYVLRYQRGSQLGLGILTVILGERVGIDLSLVLMKGNWLLLNQSSQKNLLYNPEQQGALLIRSEEMCVEEAYRRDHFLADSLAASTEDILEEVIESHINGYKEGGQINRESEMTEKLEALKHERDRRELTGFLLKN